MGGARRTTPQGLRVPHGRVAQALQRTYGYEPVAFTTSPPTGELREWTGVLSCQQLAYRTSACFTAFLRSLRTSLQLDGRCELLNSLFAKRPGA